MNDGPTIVDPPDDRVEALAMKLLRNAQEHGIDPGDIDSARLIARRSLEASEERINDPATTDPEDDGVIRRTSGETSSSGDTTTKRTMPTGG